MTSKAARMRAPASIRVLVPELLVGLVLVVALHFLRLNILLERSNNVWNAFDIERQIVKIFDALALVVHVAATNVVAHLSAEEPFQGVLTGSPFHFCLEIVAQDPIELLDIMLGERLPRIPAETAG